jgi:DNA-binding response OmpR family regulator
VDEDEQFRALFRQILQEQGYEVLEASDGRTALRLMWTSPYRLVVIFAQTFPERDGLTVLSAVLADPPLARYHAYLLLSVAPCLSPSLEALVSTLKVPIITHPQDLRSVLKRISRLAHRLEAKRNHSRRHLSAEIKDNMLVSEHC